MLKNSIFICSLILLIVTELSFGFIPADEKDTINEVIIVTASRAPITFDHLTRDVEILDAEEIRKLPVRTIQEALEYIAGTEIRTRGPLGIQADIGIRGSTYEQVLILIDGVKMNNPQTGHFNLNLPVNISDIERIEVLKGSASRIYGDGSFAGVINIITRKPADGRINTRLTAGSYGYYDGSVSLDFPTGPIANKISFNQSHSDGYIHNTDFDMTTVNLNSKFDIKQGRLNISAGLTDKKYGANSFYSDKFPDQWEHTSTKYLNLSADLLARGLLFSPKISFMSSDDTFLLERDNPDFYRNDHFVDRMTFELNSSLTYDLGSISVGIEYTSDEIESDRLGNHKNEKFGIYVEKQLNLKDRIYIVAGASASWYEFSDWIICPGIDAGYKFSDSFNIFMSINRSFRMPTFTELYYNDPVHIGNPDLEPEKAWTYEFGSTLTLGPARWKTSFSRRVGLNLIDWARQSIDFPWEARNIRDINSNCFEIQLAYELPLSSNIFSRPEIRLSYEYISADTIDDVMQSKYVFDYLKHRLNAGIGLKLFSSIDIYWNTRYFQRINSKAVFLTDLKCKTDIESFTLSVEFKNIFDTHYEDFNSITLPGRWIFIGMNFSSSK